MPMCVPVRTPDDFWATTKRDDSNSLLCQRNELLGGVYRVCVADDSGGSLLQVAASRTQEGCEADWQWALGVLASESKRGRVPQPDKLAAAFVTLWNKAHAKAERQQQPHTAPPDAKQFATWCAELDRAAEDVARAEDTTCRVLHVADHFDSHGFPAVTAQPTLPAAAPSATAPMASSPRAMPAHRPQRATVAVEYSSTRQIQERRLRLALNSYRSVVKQPQSLPGQQQRLARAQLRALSASTDSLAKQQHPEEVEGGLSSSVPPQPQRTPPRPQSQFNLLEGNGVPSSSYQPSLHSPRRATTQAQLFRPRTQQIGGSSSDPPHI